MKSKFIILSVFCNLIIMAAYGQIRFESSYMSPSSYRDATNTAVGGKGDFKDMRLGVQIPVYQKLNERNQPTAWAVAAKGLYASMNNSDMTRDLCIDRLLNAELGIVHLRPINEKWSLMASLGGGVYTDLSEFSGKSVLVQAGSLFIWAARPNIDFGFGVALNNVIGYPMLFPSLYFKWETGNRIEVDVIVYNDALLSAGMKMNDALTLRLLVQGRGMSAIVKRDNKPVIFTQSFSIIGLQPEIYINKMLSIPIVAGISVKREAYYLERKLISFYHAEDSYPNFATAAYFSVGLKYGFGK
jgi:hypothetical protein